MQIIDQTAAEIKSIIAEAERCRAESIALLIQSRAAIRNHAEMPEPDESDRQWAAEVLNDGQDGHTDEPTPAEVLEADEPLDPDAADARDMEAFRLLGWDVEQAEIDEMGSALGHDFNMLAGEWMALNRHEMGLCL